MCLVVFSHLTFRIVMSLFRARGLDRVFPLEGTNLVSEWILCSLLLPLLFRIRCMIPFPSFQSVLLSSFVCMMETLHGMWPRMPLSFSEMSHRVEKQIHSVLLFPLFFFFGFPLVYFFPSCLECVCFCVCMLVYPSE